MSDSHDVNASSSDRREQPFLYTWNRRLRHLHGISLRNLNTNVPHARARGKTVTDDEHNLETAAKSLVQNEARTLHHARSYDQILKSSAGEDFGQTALSPTRASTTNERAVEPRARPGKGNLRRRSTLHWATSNPRARQSKLEAVEVNRLVSSWFSIHHEELERPLYISEVMHQAMNPGFSFFDLDTSAASVARSDTFTIRVWCKNELIDDYRVLVELHVNMRSLQFVGRSLENFHHPLPENCILFHLSDGMYTSFMDLPAEGQHQPPLTQTMKGMAASSASSFDALLKLSNLDDVIQDALRTRAKLETDINRLLNHMPQAEHELSHLSSQREQTKHTRKARESEQKSLQQAAQSKAELRSSLQLRRDVTRSLPAYRAKVQEACRTLSDLSQTAHKDLMELDEKARDQVRRISTILLRVFPIEPIKNKTLQFSIRNIHLPNSTFSDTNSDVIAAALGYTAQLVHRLSLYLSIPLPYTIVPNESISYIHDDISAGIAQRQFPLHPTGAAYKFEYGVFLLNKDIEFLMNRSGLRVLDIRHTLPNLKYLMFVLTAGSGDLPGRKAGGVRGLLRATMTPDISRRNSEESLTSQNNVTQQDKEKMSDMDDIFGHVRARGLPYRRSMLRDTG